MLKDRERFNFSGIKWTWEGGGIWIGGRDWRQCYNLGINSPPLFRGHCWHTGAASLPLDIACTVRTVDSAEHCDVSMVHAEWWTSFPLSTTAMPPKTISVPTAINPTTRVGPGHASHSLYLFPPPSSLLYFHYLFFHPLCFILSFLLPNT